MSISFARFMRNEESEVRIAAVGYPIAAALCEAELLCIKTRLDVAFRSRRHAIAQSSRYLSTPRLLMEAVSAYTAYYLLALLRPFASPEKREEHLATVLAFVARQPLP